MKFKINIKRSAFQPFVVEADDEDEAFIKAEQEAMNSGGWNSADCEYAVVDEDGEEVKLL